MARVTLERVAACAVLAGCRPEYFPVVVAAVEAVLEPAFNVGGQAVTTQPCGQVIVVNGPVRDAIGLNGSVGALGPGWRREHDDRARAAARGQPDRGRVPGPSRPLDARQPRQDRDVLRRGRGGESVGAAPRLARVSPRSSSVVTVVGADAPLSISDHRSTGPLELARVLGEAAAADLESELVAARRGLAVRDLPRARSVVRASGGGARSACARRCSRRSSRPARVVALGRDHAAGQRGPGR